MRLGPIFRFKPQGRFQKPYLFPEEPEINPPQAKAGSLTALGLFLFCPKIKPEGVIGLSGRYIASCSFGKDSLAAIICRLENGEPVYEAVYCRVMFDDNISAEFPEHEHWIHNHAIPLLEARYGVTTTIVQAETTYCKQFYTKYIRSKGKNGLNYGFPLLRGPWCNSRLKVRPIQKWQKTVGGYHAIVGIAADELNRKDRDTVKGKILPLVDYGVTEAEAFNICRRAGLLSPRV
jgi:hypothetical protein